MVKRLLIRLVYEYGSKALNSVFKAYKDTVKTAPKAGAEKKKSEEVADAAAATAVAAASANDTVAPVKVAPSVDIL